MSLQKGLMLAFKERNFCNMNATKALVHRCSIKQLLCPQKTRTIDRKTCNGFLFGKVVGLDRFSVEHLWVTASNPQLTRLEVTAIKFVMGNKFEYIIMLLSYPIFGKNTLLNIWMLFFLYVSHNFLTSFVTEAVIIQKPVH